jgi:uncharacterized protein (TIGR02145 family)
MNRTYSILGYIIIVAFLPFAANSQVKDIDGNVYKIMKIGAQTWMVENLKTTRYNDGTAIPNVTSKAIWDGLTKGAYCDYNNTPANSHTYGRLYNWYVGASTNPKNVCPTGWHVPTDVKWTILITYLGGGRVAGARLKEKGTIHWAGPNTGATNEVGFSALPGGYRYGNGVFTSIGSDGTWWSSTEYNAKYAWDRHMHCSYSSVGRWGINKSSGFSIRCLKD